MAFLVIKVIAFACLIALISGSSTPAHPNAPSSEFQRQILEKWYREFAEISNSFDKQVLTQFAADKGFHTKPKGAAAAPPAPKPVSSSTTSTTTTTTSTTPKPKVQPIAVALRTGLEREDDTPSMLPSSQLSIGPVRIRYMLRTPSFPFSDPSMFDGSETTGSVKKDNPVEQAFEDLTMSRMLRRVLFPDDDEDDFAESAEQEEPYGILRAPAPPAFASRTGMSESELAESSSAWLSEMIGGQSGAKQSSSSTSTTSTTSTTTTSTTSTTTPAPEHKNWNPFTKQGFKRIFHFSI